jgi:AcrR family transcriptional regulator
MRRSAGDAARKKILDASAALFLRHGFEGTPLRAISAKAGVNLGAIYYYFKSKDQILLAILERGAASITEAVYTEIGSRLDTAPADVLIRDAIRLHVRVQLTQGNYSLASMRAAEEATPRVTKQLAPIQDRYKEFWQNLLRLAQKQGFIKPGGDLEMTRAMVLSSLNSIVKWYDPKRSGEAELEKVTNAYASLLLDGLLIKPRR